MQHRLIMFQSFCRNLVGALQLGPLNWQAMRKVIVARMHRVTFTGMWIFPWMLELYCLVSIFFGGGEYLKFVYL